MNLSAQIYRIARGAAQLAIAITLSAVAGARAETVAYVSPTITATRGYLVDWKSDNKARVVTYMGARSATFSDDGVQRVATLNKPLSYETYSNDVDCSGYQYLVRYELRQLAFRQTAGNMNAGKTAVIEMGATVALEGCNAGRSVPFGSLSDAGSPTLNRAFSERPPITDIAPGFTIAGFLEGPANLPFWQPPPAADVVTMETATTLRFQRSGSVVGAAFDDKQWLILQMPGYQRGYTRVILNDKTSTETWLVAEFSDGKPQAVLSMLMVKPTAAAGFGNKNHTAHMWEAAIGLGTTTPLYYYFYTDFTGDRVSKNLDAGTESRSPLTWRYQGTSVVQTRQSGGDPRDRIWTPVANVGKYRYVFEEERLPHPDGTYDLAFPPRLVFVVDRGPATKP